MTTGNMKVEHFVGRQLAVLQAGYLDDQPRARAQLAALRQAIAHQPGVDPQIWELTEPPSAIDIRSDQPTWDEWAVHCALTLYATHQQSKSQPMHQKDIGLGTAAARLIFITGTENPAARARFNALVTSSTFAELSYHLRTFIALLRSNDIPLDYVSLASDLVAFQKPGGAAIVRRRWARQMVQPKDSGKNPETNEGGGSPS